MAPHPNLSTGALKTIMTGADYDGEPILQVLGNKRIPGGSNDRYRLLLSDGSYLQSFSMLSTQLNEYVTNGSLSDFTIIKVSQFTTSVVNKHDNDEKRVLIIVGLSVLKSGEEVGEKIGNPISLSEANKVNGNAAAVPNPNPPAATSNAPAARPAANAAPVRSYQPPPMANLNESSSQFEGRATHPISALSPYQNKWVIKARVVTKSPIRTWNNAKGEGKLFSMDLMDESSSIRVTGFRDQVDKFYDMIEVDKIYYLTKAQIKPANKQFSTLPNDYEMTLTNDSVIQECTEQDVSVPTVKYNFVQISQIAEMEPKSIVDIIGVCKEVGDLNTFTARTTGRELKKRDITLVDQSNAAVTVTLWGDSAEKFDDYSQPVLLIKGGSINEFNGGKSVSLLGSSVLKKNPDLNEGHKLRGWFDNGGNMESIASVSARTGGGNFSAEWLSFYEANQKNLGHGDKADFFQLKGTIHIVKSTNAVYKACASADCNKKVIDLDNGMYQCEKCNISSSSFKYRMMLNMSIGDWTSNRWATCFAGEAEQILGKTSDQVGELFDSNKAEAEALLAEQHFRSMIFKLRVKNEFYGDSNRLKYTVQSAGPIKHKEYNDYLVKNIQRLTGVGKH